MISGCGCAVKIYSVIKIIYVHVQLHVSVHSYSVCVNVGLTFTYTLQRTQRRSLYSSSTTSLCRDVTAMLLQKKFLTNVVFLLNTVWIVLTWFAMCIAMIEVMHRRYTISIEVVAQEASARYWLCAGPTKC
jgi:hypothetical protein